MVDKDVRDLGRRHIFGRFSYYKLTMPISYDQHNLLPDLVRLSSPRIPIATSSRGLLAGNSLRLR